MKIIIDDYGDMQRIDKFLSEILPNVSRSKIQSQIKNQQCFVNAQNVKSSYILKEGDELIFDVTQDDFTANYLPNDIPLDIIWEDENMAVVNKPSGILTHPTTIEKQGTLVNALLYRYGNNLSDINGDIRRGIVHRLDRNTSGLIMVAKNNETHIFIVNEMKNKKYVKKYIAIVKGVIESDEFSIDSPIGRHLSQPYKMAINGKDAKDSLTKVRVLERLKDATLVELTLITGRTHQIRVHLSSIGHPVYNDTLYGFGKMKIKTEEQVLQSYKLEFTKPFTEERIMLEIPYDDKISKVLKVLKQI